MDHNTQELIDKAFNAKSRSTTSALLPDIGAALEDETGTVWTGASIENDTRTIGMCAERVALFYALSQGVTRFARIAIAKDAEVKNSHPCGVCLEALSYFAPDLELVIATPSEVQEVTLSELYPLD